MKIILSFFFMINIINISAKDAFLKDVYLGVEDVLETDTLYCMVVESLRIFPDYDLESIDEAVIEPSKIIQWDQKVATIYFSAVHRITGVTEIFSTKIESEDDTARWIMKYDVPYTSKASLYAVTNHESGPDEFSYYAFLGDCR